MLPPFTESGQLSTMSRLMSQVSSVQCLVSCSVLPPFTESGQLNTVSRRSGNTIYAPLRLSDWVSPGPAFETVPVLAWLTSALSLSVNEDRRGLVSRFNPVLLALERLAELGSHCLTKPRFPAPETLPTLPHLVLPLKGHPLSSIDAVCALGK